MHAFLKELRWASRTLLKTPGVTLVVIGVMALGIGANTAIFSVVNAVLLQPLPYPDPDRLMVLNEEGARGRLSVSYPGFLDWREQARSFERVEGSRAQTFTLTGIEPADRVQSRLVSAGLFEMLGTHPVLGRLFTAEDDQRGAPPVAVLSYDCWKTRFAGDPNILNRKLIFNDIPTVVIGVLPPGFRYTARLDEVYVTLAQLPTSLGTSSSALDRGNHQGLVVLARLKPGVSQAQAAEEMKAISARLEQQYPATNSGLHAIMQPLSEILIGDVRTTLLVLLAAVAFVLLIACANVANLLLARATARRKEVAIRVALGAGRWRIIRQLLTESILLAAAAGAVGLLLAYWGLRALLQIAPRGIFRLSDTHIDPWVLAFTALASLLTGMLFGLVPAWHATRFDVTASLKSEDRGATAGRSSHRLRRLLLAAEIALALVLSTGAGLMIRSLWNVRQVDPGFKPENLLTATVSLNRSYPREDQRIAFYEQAIERLSALPGVQSASATSCLPIGGSCWGSVFIIEGRVVPERSLLLVSQFKVATPGLFETMGVRLVRGRTFTRLDSNRANNVVVINEMAAQRFFPGEDPIGKRIKQGWPESPTPWREIVGVVGDVRQNGLDSEQLPEIYMPYAQSTQYTMSFVVRVAGASGGVISGMREVFRDLNRDIPLYGIRPMDELLDISVAQRRFSMLVLSLFAGLALLLSAAGIYAVISYSVSQRTKEIGIRMALGAGQEHVLGMVVREGMITTLLGIVVGALGALATTRLMKTLLFGVSSDDPGSYAGVALLLALVALLACYIPARRATQIDPLVALRHE